MKDIAVFVLYQLIYSLVKCVPATAKSKNLLLIKTDEIGDYILARNLLQYFKNSEKYKDYKITFIGNAIFKQIFDAYDSAISNDAIWVNKKKFRTNFGYRFKVLLLLRKSGYSDVVNLVYSRSFRIDDVMAGVTTATEKISMSEKPFYWSKFEKVITPKHLYTKIIDLNNDLLFDAIRNTRFTERILQRSIPVDLKINATEDIGHLTLPQAYFIVFPGSGLKNKKWPSEHFSAVTKHIKLKYNLDPVVCGAPADQPDSSEFIQQYGGPVIDLTGKTTLPEFLTILKNATCLVSVDTGSVHMAAAVGCPVFALFSGLHYGRFSPYPVDIAPDFFPVYPDQVEDIISREAYAALQNIPPDLLKNIQPEKVINTIDQYLPKILDTNSIRGNSGFKL